MGQRGERDNNARKDAGQGRKGRMERMWLGAMLGNRRG